MGTLDSVHRGTLTHRMDGSVVFEIPQYQSIDERMGRVRSQISIVWKQLEDHGNKITHIRGDIRLHGGRYELPRLRGYTGHLSIEDQAEFRAPNLTYIEGDLLALGVQRDSDFERLETVTGNLSMKLTANPFPSLQRVVHNLELTLAARDKSICKMPRLIMIGGAVSGPDIEEEALADVHLVMPRLRVVGNQTGDLFDRIDHPELEQLERFGSIVWRSGVSEAFSKWARHYAEQDRQFVDAMYDADLSAMEPHDQHPAM